MSLYDRHGLRIALLGCVLFPFAIYAAVQSLLTNSNEVKDWLPPSYAETTDFEWFRRYFPNDEFVVVAWTGGTVDDERLDRFLANVQASEQHDPLGKTRFPRKISGRTAIDDLQAAFAELSREEAVEKLKGALVGPDGSHTAAVVYISDEARRDVHGTLRILRDAAIASGVAESDLRMGGTPVVNAAIDRISGQSLNRVLIVCVIVVSLTAWWLIRNVGLMILILITGLYAAANSLTMLWLTGTPMNAILITMIPMVYVSATSGAIHVCNYYVESVHEEGIVGAADRAVRHALIPLCLATATTAAGLLSICYTDLALIRTFGIYSAIGVTLSCVLLIFWLPAALSVWGRYAAKKTLHVSGLPVSQEEHDTGEAALPAFWRRLGETVVRRPNAFAAPCLLLGLLCLPGLWRLNVSIDFMKEFRADSELVRTYTWLEEKLGALMPLEVVVRINEKSELTMPQRMRLVERLQRRFEQLPGTGGSISAATYAPEIDSFGPLVIREAVRSKRLQKDRPRLISSGYLAQGEKEELWRISLRVLALREVNYAELIRQAKHQVALELDSDPESLRPNISATFTGIAPVLFKARQSLVDGLFWGIMSDLILIVATVTVLMRHWSSGLLMTLTSLFPTILVLGATGSLGIQLDLGAIMAPCVALGVTVDDVIHFLLWFRTGVRRGMQRPEAVLLAWRACVRPMYQSWTLLGLGMGCLLVSDFIPILQFGMIMAAMLTIGLIGNVILLPALLAGPLGGFISSHALRKDRVV